MLAKIKQWFRPVCTICQGDPHYKYSNLGDSVFIDDILAKLGDNGFTSHTYVGKQYTKHNLIDDLRRLV